MRIDRVESRLPWTPFLRFLETSFGRAHERPAVRVRWFDDGPWWSTDIAACEASPAPDLVAPGIDVRFTGTSEVVHGLDLGAASVRERVGRATDGCREVPRLPWMCD